MQINEIRLNGFRAHTSTTVPFREGINLLVGPNGAGKTNVLEAVHVACLSRSFLTHNDRYVLQRGAGHYEVEGRFTSDAGKEVRVRVAYQPDGGKRVQVNGAPLERLTDLVGRVPVVVFAPDDQRITAEGPDERRRFLDSLLCQSSATYLENLVAYRRILKQRNELLLSGRRRRQAADADMLHAWTEELIKYGVPVVHARLRFVAAFNRHLETAYGRIAEVAERPSMAYAPFPGLGSGEAEKEFRAEQEGAAGQVEQAFREALERNAQAERQRGSTQAGPHRDELDMLLDGHLVRRYGSQGQHRTFGMALKLAQYDYLHEALDERPVLLLDDVFDNLDPGRIRAFLNILQSDAVGQSITTAARREIVHDHFPGGPCTTMTVESEGRVGPPVSMP
ncbi:MAG: DNA replication/repair protein RecF [Rhodothermales bacterium]